MQSARVEYNILILNINYKARFIIETIGTTVINKNTLVNNYFLYSIHIFHFLLRFTMIY